MIKIKKLGDRKDGKRVRNINGMSHIMYHIKKKRNSSEVYINKPLDVTELIKYEKNLNKDESNHITYFHLFCTAIAKTIYNRPYLNRFVVNGHYYDRDDVLLSYVAKTEFNDDSKEVMQIVKVKDKDNIFSLSEKISYIVKEARKNSTSGADNLVNTLGNLPKFLRGIIVSIFKFLDRHDLLPTSLTSELIYYSSVIVSNLGSIGCKEAIHHNLTDFGTNSVLITMGKIYKKEIIDENGKKETRDFCDFGITLDERIADGFYMIKSVDILEYILLHPKTLEDNANKIIKIK